MEKRFVYADNAATTQISEAVLDAMMPYLRESFGNPSNTVYAKGREAKIALEKARAQAAAALGADVKEIYFTSGGSESINWAIKGVAKILAAKGKKHIITSSFEHHAVMHTLGALKKDGFTVTELPVYSDGIVRIEDLASAIREDTALVTIMYANNEIGTIQPVAEIGRLCRERGVLFHTDAVQAVGNIDIDVKAQNIDLLSLSGHKLHAQKGVGALYIDKGVPYFPNLIEGGAQEGKRRAGTENVAAIVGLGAAMEIYCGDIPTRTERVRAMSNKLLDGLLKIPRTHLNGHRDKRLAGNINVAFEGIEGESMLISLDMAGICASTGSACTSGSLEPSHVLLAIGLPHGTAHGTLRLSLSDETTDEDIGYILQQLTPIVERLRAMSPLWEQILKEEGEKI